MLAFVIVAFLPLINADEAPIPGKSYVIHNGATNRYLVLMGDQTHVRNRGDEEGWANSRNFSTIAGFKPTKHSSGNLPTIDQACFTFKKYSDDEWIIEHKNTGRWLLTPDKEDIRKKRGWEWGWLKASGTKASDDNYYNLVYYILRIWSDGIYMEHKTSGRWVLAAGSSDAKEPKDVVNADSNYYSRALWTLIPRNEC